MNHSLSVFCFITCQILCNIAVMFGWYVSLWSDCQYSGLVSCLQIFILFCQSFVMALICFSSEINREMLRKSNATLHLIDEECYMVPHSSPIRQRVLHHSPTSIFEIDTAEIGGLFGLFDCNTLNSFIWILRLNNLLIVVMKGAIKWAS